MKKIGYATLTYLMKFDPATHKFDADNLDENAFVEYITQAMEKIASGIKEQFGFEYDDLEVCIADNTYSEEEQ